VKNFWPINKNLSDFAHYFFPTQQKLAHWYKNPGYDTVNMGLYTAYFADFFMASQGYIEQK
jgi:hypothetical protein